jgi:hypothetical protein
LKPDGTHWSELKGPASRSALSNELDLALADFPSFLTETGSGWSEWLCEEVEHLVDVIEGYPTPGERHAAMNSVLFELVERLMPNPEETARKTQGKYPESGS